MLCALSCIIAYFCKFLTFGGSVRITFESLPLILSGMLFGPIWGFFCGVAADFLNTAVSAYGIGGINPIITFGAGCIGLVAGLSLNYFFRKGKPWLRILISVFLSHVIANMIVKTTGLRVMYGYAWPLLWPRIPLYTAIALAEFFFILLLSKTKLLTLLKAQNSRGKRK